MAQTSFPPPPYGDGRGLLPWRATTPATSNFPLLSFPQLTLNEYLIPTACRELPSLPPCVRACAWGRACMSVAVGGTKDGSSGTFRGIWTEPLGVQEASLKRNDALLVPVHFPPTHSRCLGAHRLLSEGHSFRSHPKVGCSRVPGTAPQAVLVPGWPPSSPGKLDPSWA